MLVSRAFVRRALQIQFDAKVSPSLVERVCRELQRHFKQITQEIACNKAKEDDIRRGQKLRVRTTLGNVHYQSRHDEDSPIPNRAAIVSNLGAQGVDNG